MNQIRILPEKVAVRIAAGEVIDRPGSVVRELIDNSVDAGADRIIVTMAKGGKSLIKVSDNGIGMSRDDLLLCIERHATSKIRKVDDLQAINSLGFRGEALASVAAVSRLIITTRQAEAMVGHQLKVSGGKILALEEVGTLQGTIVEVRDLFFNVPVRKKFLRAAKTEADNIADVFSRAALGFESIHFTLKNEQRTVMNLPVSGGIIPRLAAVVGRTVAEQMIACSGEVTGIRIRAHLAPPDFARSRPDHMYVYVNRRNVRDKLINKAIMEGYGQRLMKGLYPQVAVFIEADPALVDFNVHPAKQEVRFRDPTALFKEIVHAVDRGLGVKVYPYSMDFPEKKIAGPVGEPVQMSWGGTATGTTVLQSRKQNQVEPEALSILGEKVRILGQLKDTYILCEGRDSLFIIDQHAAHERILYEKLMQGLKESTLEAQKLLLPKTIELSAREKGIIEAKGELLSAFGIEVEDFGGQAIVLQAVPALMGNADWEVLIRELISVLAEDKLEKELLLGRVVSAMACHGAIKAGDTMSGVEIRDLLEQLDRARLPTNCPHGRPVFRRITYHELEKMFKRVI